MAELHVRRELQRLIHGIISPCLEQHHRNRLAGEGISDDELSHHTVAESRQCNVR